MKDEESRHQARVVIGTGKEQAAQELDGGEVTRIVVLGDFGARADSATDLAERRSRAIDVDEFERVFARLDVRWKMASSAEGVPTVELKIGSIDDFGPEKLAENVSPLRDLLALRADADDPSRLDAVGARLGLPRPAIDRPAEEPNPASARVTPSALLDQILEGRPGAAPAMLLDDEIQRLAVDAAAGHTVAIDPKRVAGLRAAVDDRLSAAMNAVLHDPDFRHLETVWRGLWWFLRRTQGDARTSIHLLQVTKAELLRDMLQADSADTSVLGRRLLDEAAIPGGRAPDLVVGLYEFGAADHDVVLLHSLASIAERAQSPLLCAAAPSLLNCTDFGALPRAEAIAENWAAERLEPWNALRSLPAARWLALAAPRWLCRAPYDVEIAAGWRFREHVASHDHFGWAHPAWILAAILVTGRAQGRSPRQIAAEAHVVDGLPIHIRQLDGDRVALPCAETLMTEAQARAMAAGGLAPLASYRDRDAILLPCLQSLARAPIGRPV